MATLLDPAVLDDALSALEGWGGDSSAIHREVAVPVAEQESLLADIATAADAMDHHPDISRGDGHLAISLSTHSVGGVTELDIALAARIDDFVLHASHHHRDLQGDVVDDAAPVAATTVQTVEDEPHVDEPTPTVTPGLGGTVDTHADDDRPHTIR